MPYHFLFPIGDWSGDGHAFVAEYLVKSEGTLKDVRETHFANKWVGEMCSEYNDNKIGIDLLMDAFEEKGAELAYNLAKNSPLNLVDSYDETYSDEDFTFNMLDMSFKVKPEVLAQKKKESPSRYDKYDESSFVQSLSLEMSYEAMIEFWVFALNYYNPQLKLEVVSQAMSKYFVKYKGYPHKPDGSINFYGYDELKRHLKTPGYGVWSGDEDNEFYLE